jgi:hypothetical protein
MASSARPGRRPPPQRAAVDPRQGSGCVERARALLFVCAVSYSCVRHFIRLLVCLFAATTKLPHLSPNPGGLLTVNFHPDLITLAAEARQWARMCLGVPCALSELASSVERLRPLREAALMLVSEYNQVGTSRRALVCSWVFLRCVCVVLCCVVLCCVVLCCVVLCCVVLCCVVLFCVVLCCVVLCCVVLCCVVFVCVFVVETKRRNAEKKVCCCRSL